MAQDSTTKPTQDTASKPAQDATTNPAEGPWMVRLRLLSMSNANRSAPFTAADTNFAADALHVSDKVFPEVDFSYFFTHHWATELILTYPQDHAVSLAGVGNIGTIRHLPPTFTFQYHLPIPHTRLSPYVGLGFNFVWLTSVSLNAAGIPLDVTRTSVGFAYQIGVDYGLGKHFYLNLDYKHLNLNPDIKVKATEAKLTNAEIDPDLLSVGLGYRF
jgi:outer membrane protein